MINNCKHLKQKKYKKGKKLIEKIRSIKDCGIDKIYRNKTFNNFDRLKNSEILDAVLKYAREFRKNKAEGTGLFLEGGTGTGKTHLLAAIIDYIARLYKRYLEPGDLIYRKVSNLISEIGDSLLSAPSKDVINRYKTVPVLFLDDLSYRNLKEWARDMIDEIIDYRYKNKLSIIITTSEKFILLSKKTQKTIRDRCVQGSLEDGDYWVYICEKILTKNKIKLKIT